MLAREAHSLLPVNPEGCKIARAAAASPLIEAGNIYLPQPALATVGKRFHRRVRSIPPTERTTINAMTQALLRWHMAVEQETVLYIPDYPGGYQISPL